MKTRDILIAVYEDRAYRRTTGSGRKASADRKVLVRRKTRRALKNADRLDVAVRKK